MDEEMLMPVEVHSCGSLLNMFRRNYGKALCGCMTVLSTIVIVVSALSLKGSTVKSSGSIASTVAVYKYMNRSIDPCSDFYSFCCGSWPGNEKMDGDEEVLVTQFNILQKKVNSELLNVIENLSDISDLPSIVQSAVHFYRSCTNPVVVSQASLESLLSFFSSIGGWPVLNETAWSEGGFIWTEAVAKTLQTLGIDTFIGFYISVDDKNTSQNIVLLGPPILHVEPLSSPSTSALHMLYLIIKTLNFHPVNFSEISVDIDEVIKFEKALRSLLKPVDRLKTFIESTRMTIAELQQRIPQLNWLYFIQSVVNSSSKDSVFINSHFEVLVHDLDCLKSVVTFLESSTFSRRTIANFIGNVIVQELYIIIPGIFENYAHIFDMPLKEITLKRKQVCFEKMSQNFVLPLDYLYVRSNFGFNRNKSSRFIQYLKSAFKGLTFDADWLDNKTKLMAVRKLDLLMEVVGYPVILDNDSELDKLYENFPTMSSDALRNYFQVSAFFARKEIQKLRLTNVREKFLPPRPATDVGAYYMVNWNALVYPLSMHNKPFYHENGPWYVNFGAIGSIIAHEITHAFDNRGHERDEFGNCRNWWTDSSLLEYKKRAQCFEKQFNDYKICNTNQSINGSRTLGENIADSGGLRQAYFAYQLWKNDNGVENPLSGLEDYTPEQLFFISFATVWCTKMSHDTEVNFYGKGTHSPPAFRVLGSVSNSEDFAKAFNCSKGTPMNPEKKCLLW